MAQRKGFFEVLFDFSFSEFIVLRVIGILYGIGIFFIGVGLLVLLAATFSQSVGAGLFFLIISPLLFLLYVTILRIGLEGLVAAFRTADNTRQIAENTKYLRPH